MADRASLGPIQVTGNDVWTLNDAFRQLTERIDAIKGLRGRTLIYDRIRSDDPQEDQDVLTRGSLSTVAQVIFITPPNNILFRKPGVSFVEPRQELRRKYNFEGGQATTARLCAVAWGTHSGTKSLRVTNGVEPLATLSWSGTSEGLHVGTATALDLNDGDLDNSLRLQCAASHAEESIIFNWVMLELSG
jgi:hypothetical protein